MKWSRPSWLRARSGHAVMALALGGIALIGVAHRVADQQAQDLMALHEDIDIIRISIERSLAPLQFPVDVPLSLAQRARSLGELDRAKRSAEQLVQRSTRARLETFYQASDYQLPRGAATLAQAIAEQRAAIKNALHHADPGLKLALQAGMRQLRTQVNALDDALAAHFVQRRNGLYRLHALMMASVAALGAVGLWLLQREQGRRHRAANVLRLREDQLQALVAAVPDVVALLDANGRVLASSSTRPEWALGHSSAASPMPLSEILPRTLCDAVLGKIQSCIDDKRVSAFEYQREINSQAISFDSRLSPLRGRQQVVWVSWDTPRVGKASAAPRSLAVTTTSSVTSIKRSSGFAMQTVYCSEYAQSRRNMETSPMLGLPAACPGNSRCTPSTWSAPMTRSIIPSMSASCWSIPTRRCIPLSWAATSSV